MHMKTNLHGEYSSQQVENEDRAQEDDRDKVHPCISIPQRRHILGGGGGRGEEGEGRGERGRRERGREGG